MDLLTRDKHFVPIQSHKRAQQKEDGGGGAVVVDIEPM